ncbi:MAG TPA: tetratricopeptide repeat protein [Pseudonocardiaceae bacterium]|nr:tetratricopeptide repeat protein [Pseudonocardiaceae bacterium]
MGDEDFGTELRRLRTAAGWSLTELANRIHYTKGYLSKVENGLAPPNDALATLCDAELETGGVLIAVVPRRRRKIRSRTFTVRPSGLPPATPFFTGREAELAEVCGILRANYARSPGACALNGMAGIGKTALAVLAAHQVADEFPDGMLFIDLRAHGGREVDSTDALDRLLRQLGVPGDEVPRSPEERAVFYRGCLRDRRVLVVVDNARSTQQVLPLLPGDPGCRLLVTSRSRLIALDDAHHVSLGPMTEAEAVTLFSSIAGRGRLPDGADGRRTLARIVDRCGRLPLAIRIAAARYQSNPVWTLADLDERLADSKTLFHELDDGERSVHGAFQLSWDGLPEDQRLLLALCTLHPGNDVDAQTAGALADVPVGRAQRLLDRLHTAHLLVPQPGARYQCHDLLRVFAAQTGLRDVAHARQQQAVIRLVDHAVHAAAGADVVISASRFRPELTYDHLPPDVRSFADAAEAMTWLGIEWPALTALVTVAAERGLHDRAWQLAFMLRGYFYLTKQWDPWIETHQVALASARAADNRWAEAVTLNNLGIAHIDRGELDIATGYYETALPLFRELKDDHGEVNTLANLGWVHHYRGAHEAALRDLTTALEFYQRTGAARNAAITRRGIALAQTELGAYAESLTHATEALAVFERLGLLLDATMALNCIGWTNFRSGHHEQAATAYRRAVEVGEQADSKYEVARAKTGLGNIAAAADDVATAQRHWDEAQQCYPDLNTTMVGESRAHQAGLSPR